jgi:hypothetical protein
MPGFADSAEGRAGQAEFCSSVRAFAESSLDDAGLRRLWFLPMGVYDDGSYDHYAPVQADPFDEVVESPILDNIDWLTHHTTAVQFGESLSMCFTRSAGYQPLDFEQADRTMRASFEHRARGRRIEIASADDTTTFVVAARNVTDLASAMNRPVDGGEEE